MKLDFYLFVYIFAQLFRHSFLWFIVTQMKEESKNEQSTSTCSASTSNIEKKERKSRIIRILLTLELDEAQIEQKTKKKKKKKKEEEEEQEEEKEKQKKEKDQTKCSQCRIKIDRFSEKNDNVLCPLWFNQYCSLCHFNKFGQFSDCQKNQQLELSTRFSRVKQATNFIEIFASAFGYHIFQYRSFVHLLLCQNKRKADDQ